MKNPASPFPFWGHRTLAEVEETKRLVTMKAEHRPLPHKGGERLHTLLWKAEQFNPPPAPAMPGDAA